MCTAGMVIFDSVSNISHICEGGEASVDLFICCSFPSKMLVTLNPASSGEIVHHLWEALCMVSEHRSFIKRKKSIPTPLLYLGRLDNAEETSPTFPMLSLSILHVFQCTVPSESSVLCAHPSSSPSLLRYLNVFITFLTIRESHSLTVSFI